MEKYHPQTFLCTSEFKVSNNYHKKLPMNDTYVNCSFPCLITMYDTTSNGKQASKIRIKVSFSCKILLCTETPNEYLKI